MSKKNNDPGFKNVVIEESTPLCNNIEDNGLCMFCKKTLCECDDSATYGYVILELDECKLVGDLAKLRRDRFTKTEKERADKEYADSSRMAAAKLRAEKQPKDTFKLTEEQRSKIFRSNNSVERYIRTGEY